MAEEGSQSAGSNPKLVLLALGVAVFAVIVVNVYIEMIQNRMHEESFVAYRLRRPLHPGDTLERDHLRPVRIPTRFEDAFPSVLKRKDLELELGQTIHRFAPEGSFASYKLLEERERSTFDQRVDPGMRGKGLPVSDETIPGEVRPGMFVDIEAPLPQPGGGVRVMTVMERVKVLAVGNRTIVDESEAGSEDGTERYRRITVQVTPEQATQLDNIRRAAVGKFELLLRNPTDREHPKIGSGEINPEVLELVKNR